MFKVNSSDHTQVYTVCIKETSCDTDSSCIRRCTFPEYGHSVCRNRIECTCYDYTHGHLCKHVHKVKMILQPEEDLSTLDQLDVSDQDQDDIVYSVASPKKQKATGLLSLHHYRGISI